MVDDTPPPHEPDATADPRAQSVPSLSDPDALDALTSRRRRYALLALANSPDGVAEVDGLADQIQRWECAAAEEVPDDHYDRIVAALHHIDLPKLADVGLLEFDPRSDVVRYRGEEAHEAVAEFIEAMTVD